MQHTLCRKLMDAYYSRGEDITGVDILTRYAQECGYNPDEVRQELTRQGLPEETDQLCAQTSRQFRIRGVPHIVVGGKVTISGAAAPESIVRAVQRC